MTWVTKKLHESIAKLNYEFNIGVGGVGGGGGGGGEPWFF